jgi:hypothetical protein
LWAVTLAGCTGQFCGVPDGRHRSDVVDSVFKRRHGVPESLVHDPVMNLSRELTAIEDDLRRDGTITIKKPDVWGDGDLMYFLQEFDAQLVTRTRTFGETLQAYVARSDQAEFQSTTGLAAALGQSGAASGSASSSGSSAPADETSDATKDNVPLWDLIGKSKAAAAPAQASIGVEPTEVARQHATYIDVCQAIRRRHMGDDTCRSAGYGLYKFRVPVSVLPGRETSQGHSAVVTIRARLQVDEANLRYTFPKLVVADLVDELTPIMREKMGPSGGAVGRVQGGATKATPRAPSLGTPATLGNPEEVLGETTVGAICTLVKKQITRDQGAVAVAPGDGETRAALFRVLSQVTSILEENDALGLGDNDQGIYAHAAADELQRGRINTSVRDGWIAAVKDCGKSSGACADWPEAGWAIALQSGLLDINLKRICKELQVRKRIGEADVQSLNEIYFFLPEHRGSAAHYWETIVKESFPLSVFAIDPQVEEQNAYDAFARRRELQLALAYNVAKGRFNMAQKLAFSRQLALDQATIALNRTVVGFSHGEDTFGWYFFPRVQSPPAEQTNIGAVARTIWSTGPTEHYDLKHRKLEPGMRECEVLIAMPRFVTDVAFEVTTNWESIAKPGVTKRSYEEMMAQGRRIEQLKRCLGPLCGANCYRPGDVERLVSRIDQLELMLGMQTYYLRVPYEYEQSGHDLFDTGNVHLRPVLGDYYGLEYLQAGDNGEAYVFLTGKNFHPTLTHVIIGGRESHSVSDAAGASADVEVINRELLRVKISKLNEKLSAKDGFQVRVGTPAGLSNPLWIPPQAATPAAAAKGWSFAQPSNVQAILYKPCCIDKDGVRRFEFCKPDPEVVVKHNLDVPLPKDMNGQFVGEVTATKKDGTSILFGLQAEESLTTKWIPLAYTGKTWKIDWQQLGTEVVRLIRENPLAIGEESFSMTITGYVCFDKFPVTKMLNEIKVSVEPCDCAAPCPADHGSASEVRVQPQRASGTPAGGGRPMESVNRNREMAGRTPGSLAFPDRNGSNWRPNAAGNSLESIPTPLPAVPGSRGTPTAR